MPDAIEILRAARELISVPERWTQGAGARDANGREAQGHNDAVCWCLMGATCYSDDEGLGFAADRFIKLAIGSSDIAGFNDAPGRTHAEILAVMDKAIALAEARNA